MPNVSLLLQSCVNPHYPTVGEALCVCPSPSCLELGSRSASWMWKSLWLHRAVLQVLASLEKLCVKAVLQISANYFVVSEQFG